jgi:hypothetical protein
LGDKDTASVARHVDNKLRPLPPQEYIVLIGGCTNTFNGWHSFAYDATGQDYVWDPMPAPHTRTEVPYMFKTPQAVDLKTIPKEKWIQYGWSEYGANELNTKGWNGKDVQPYRPETHDLYWANFVDPASRLFLYDGPLSNPHQRPAPKKGDIVSFFIYLPAYQMRQDLDWAASPFNFRNKDKYVDPTTNPQSADWWKAPATPMPERVTLPLSRTWRTVEDEENARKKKLADAKAREAEKVRKLSEEDINFYILMSTTSENTDRVIKRPKYPTDYIEYLRGDLGGGPLGTVYQFGALSKVFLFWEPSQFIDYVHSGKWEGVEWTGGGPENDEKGNDRNFVFMPGRPVRRDAFGRPMKVTTPWYKHWDKTPRVDRDIVKIRRFDYFGHSDATSMMLQYGWKNEKGEPPDSDLTLEFHDLEKCFKGNVLTHDATAELWGCNLGSNDDAGNPGIAPRLAEKFFKGGVVAADRRTVFDHILDNDTNMPEPTPGEELNADHTAYVEVPGKWTFYPHKK